jgi:hypothetical protein
VGDRYKRNLLLHTNLFLKESQKNPFSQGAQNLDNSNRSRSTLKNLFSTGIAGQRTFPPMLVTARQAVTLASGKSKNSIAENRQ